MLISLAAKPSVELALSLPVLSRYPSLGQILSTVPTKPSNSDGYSDSKVEIRFYSRTNTDS